MKLGDSAASGEMMATLLAIVLRREQVPEDLPGQRKVIKDPNLIFPGQKIGILPT